MIPRPTLGVSYVHQFTRRPVAVELDDLLNDIKESAIRWQRDWLPHAGYRIEPLSIFRNRLSAETLERVVNFTMHRAVLPRFETPPHKRASGVDEIKRVAQKQQLLKLQVRNVLSPSVSLLEQEVRYGSGIDRLRQLESP